MISHITIGVDDVLAAQKFYDAVLQPLGYVRRHTYPEALAYGPPAENTPTQLWVMQPFNNQPAQPGNGWHAALLAPDNAAVDNFYKLALSLGGSCEGAPGLRPHYHEGYYAAYVRDPVGNKIQAVCHNGHLDVI
jgi:catechol 2,3-dioxygenase-like lactoylglutathione lyase family enzyme